VQVTVGAENSKTLVQVLGFTCSGPSGPITSAVYGSNISCTNSSTGSTTIYSGYLLRVDVTNSTGNLCTNSTTGIPAYQCPPGAVTVTNNGGPVVDVGAPSDYSSTYSLNSQGYAEDQYIQLPGGTDNLSVTYAPHPIAPNNSYNQSTGTASITVSAAPTSTVLSSSASTVTSGQSVTLTATVNTSSLGVSPTGTVAFYNGSAQVGSGTVTYAGASASATAYASLTATLTTSFTANASITAAYTSADQNYSSSTTTAPLAISISGGKPDFSLTAIPSSFTITSPGASGSTAISASAIAGFTGTISLACSLSSAMTYSSCSMTPTSFSPGGTATLTVNTTAASSAPPHRTNPPTWLLPGAGLMLASTLLLLLSGKRRRAKLAFSLLVFALLAAALGSCGGGSSSVQTISGTPTGTYTATVTATSGSLSHTLNIPVTVQ
jgi:hypothetical protein